jgi:transposase
MHRYELRDDEWERIKNLLPGKKGDPGVTAKDNRLFVNAVLWVARSGAPWADLPARFGKHNSVWRRFDRWAAKGVWARILKELSDPDLELLILDSTIVRAHVDAAGAKKKPTAVVDRRGKHWAARAAASEPSSTWQSMLRVLPSSSS